MLRHLHHLVLPLILSIVPAASCLAAEGSQLDTNQQAAVEDDFAPGLAIGVVLIIVVIIGSGFVLAAVVLAALAALAILASVGIISSSIMIGFLRKRPSAGFRAFYIQAGAVAGSFCGIVLALLIVWFFDLKLGRASSCIVGGACGCLTGVGIAVLFNMAWGRGVRWAMARVEFETSRCPDGRA